MGFVAFKTTALNKILATSSLMVAMPLSLVTKQTSQDKSTEKPLLAMWIYSHICDGRVTELQMEVVPLQME